MPELICKILHIGKTTYYKYVKESYPIITFLLSLDKKELLELNTTGKIKKFELIKNMSFEDLQDKLNQPNIQSIQAVYVNRVLYSTFKKRSLAYLHFLLKKQNIKNSSDLYKFNIKKDQENFFKRFVSEWHHDSEANVLSFARNRDEFNECTKLYLTEEEINFIFQNKEVFISSVQKMLEQKLKK
jgi:hypothetical protein